MSLDVIIKTFLPRTDTRRIYLYAMGLAVGWTLTVIVSLLLTSHMQRQNTLEIARFEGRAAFDKDQTYRNWNRSLGGVYALVNDKVRPNPYLAHIPERDVVTPTGKQLTLLNSSYMTRLVEEQAKAIFGVRGHVTSLRPIRMENAPDAWERAALQAFEKGEKEVNAEIEVNGARYVRLMKPLFADHSCQKCHAAYGSKVGEVRGGISVMVPLAPLIQAESQTMASVAAAHGGIWLLGLFTLGFGSHRLARQTALRRNAELAVLEGEKRLDFLTNYDPLTALPNRTLFQTIVTRTLVGGARDNLAFALLIVDLDHFKNINDTLGHEAGDGILVNMAERLQHALRPGDTLARLGGDEFAILLYGIRDATGVSAIAARILSQSKDPFAINGRELYCGISLGIALFPMDGGDSESLIKHAEIAMYQAKAKGRACYQFYSAEMNVLTERRLALGNGLRQVVQREELVLYYQPQIDIARRRIVGMEALLRWRHPEFGLVPPGEFIPISEADGSIVEIGEWVLFESCRQAMRWYREGARDFTVAVNLSAHQFSQRNLDELVSRALAETGLPARYLELEVTESVVMKDASAARDALYALARLGVKLAIDDFGTGYSSLSYLKDFPIHRLKIDRSFVTDIAMDRSDEIIVVAIIGLARNLGLEVVAEGVETEEQFALLKTHGCQVSQGYLHGRPHPAVEWRDEPVWGLQE